MLIQVIFKLLSKIFLFVFIGYLIGKIRKGFIRALVAMVIDGSLYLFIPLFFFLSMWESSADFLVTKKVAIIGISVVVACGLMAYLFSIFYRVEFRQICLPIMFMNTIYLGIPINTLFFGREGMTYAVIYSLTEGLLSFTIGIYLVSRKERFLQVIKMPLIYAALVGVVLNQGKLGVPVILLNISQRLKDVVLPAMVGLVGYQLNFMRWRQFKLVNVGVLLRVGGGFLVALILVRLLDLSGPAASVALISSALPSAVITYVFAKKYEADADFAAGMILVGTLLSMVTVPLIVSFVR
ncbi:AEC family transporter [bacterium]|nr:AEC family transporter [bacterium]